MMSDKKKSYRGSNVGLLLSRARLLFRYYLVLDGFILSVMVLISWALFSVCLDHGFFKYFGIDLVVNSPKFLRSWQVGLMMVLMAVLLVPRLVKFLQPRTDSDFAILLERRFPAVFGDRLITSIELIDPEKMALSGYSQELVDLTKMQAENIAGAVEPSQLFIWKTLWFRSVFTSFMIFCFFPLVCGFIALERFVFRATTDYQPVPIITEAVDAISFWWDRTIRGRDVAWPRLAFTRLVDFSKLGEIKVGKGAPYTVRLRAHQFVIAGSPSAIAQKKYREWLCSGGRKPEFIDESMEAILATLDSGWRPMTWFDLDEFTPIEDIDAVPHLPANDFWLSGNLTTPALLDDILEKAESILLPKSENEITISGYTKWSDSDIALAKDVVSAIEMMRKNAGSFWLRRKIRVLDLPSEVFLSIVDDSDITDMTGGTRRPSMYRLKANSSFGKQYFHRIESVSTSILIQSLARDYESKRNRLTVLSPTMVEYLHVREERPGYLNHKIDPMLEGVSRDRALLELSQLKTPFEVGDRLMPRAEVTEIVFPAASSLILTGDLPIDRRWGFARLEELGSGNINHCFSYQVQTSGLRRLKIEIDGSRQDSIMKLRLDDSNQITGERKIRLKPVQDDPPVLEVRPSDDLRETERGYVTTMGGRIPWHGSARDKNGLGRVSQIHNIRSARDDSTSVSLIGALGMTLSSSGVGRLYPLSKVASMAYPRDNNKIFSRVGSMVGLFIAGNLPTGLAVLGHAAMPIDGISQDRRRLVPGFVKMMRETRMEDMVHVFVFEPDPVPVFGEGNDFPIIDAFSGKDLLQSVDYGRAIIELRIEAEDLDTVTLSETGVFPRPKKTAIAPIVVRLIADDDMLDLLQGDFFRLRSQVQELRDLLLPPDPSVKTFIRKLVDQQGVEIEIREMANRLDPRRRDSDGFSRILEEARSMAREIDMAYGRLLRQTNLSGFEVKREQTVVSKLLVELHQVFIPSVEGAVERFNRAIDSSANLAMTVSAMRDAGVKSRDLVQFLDQILAAMGGASDLNREIARLRGILREQDAQSRLLDSLRKELVNRLLDDLLKP